MKIHLDHVFVNEDGKPRRNIVQEENELGIPVHDANEDPQLRTQIQQALDRARSGKS